jgi:hypothetical protein
MSSQRAQYFPGQLRPCHFAGLKGCVEATPPPLSHTTDVLLFKGHQRPLPAWDRTRTPKENSTQYE